MGRRSRSHGRRRSGSSSSRRLASKSRSPLKRTASLHTPRAVLTPRSRCVSRGAPRTGTPRSQRQRAPSPRRMKCESPRDPERRHRAWLRGEPVASPVPVPFGEVVPGEFLRDVEKICRLRRPPGAAGQRQVGISSVRWRFLFDSVGGGLRDGRLCTESKPSHRKRVFASLLLPLSLYRRAYLIDTYGGCGRVVVGVSSIKYLVRIWLFRSGLLFPFGLLLWQ